jgi:thioredoxin 1
LSGRLWPAAKAALVLLLLLMALGYVACERSPETEHTPRASTGPFVAGLPSLLEFGRGICPTCRKMEPIIAEIAKEYKGRLNVRSVSLDEERELGAKYGINLIPTQVLLDAQGREVARHVGFIVKEDLVSKMKALKLLQ